MKAAWEEGRKELLYPYGKTYAKKDRRIGIERLSHLSAGYGGLNSSQAIVQRRDFQHRHKPRVIPEAHQIHCAFE